MSRLPDGIKHKKIPRVHVKEREDSMKCSYIAIEREYGSGGTEIARRLAAECGIACYGREILEAVAQKNAIPVERIERYEETATGSFLYTIFMMSRTHAASQDLVTAEGHVYLAEREEMQQMAAKGPAIFVGHCAGEALKNREGVVRVFIRADEAEKKRRICGEYQIPESQAETFRKRYDKRRANYYYANTMKRWDDYKNYDIVLDSGKLGVDGCVAVLKGLFEQIKEVPCFNCEEQ